MPETRLRRARSGYEGYVYEPPSEKRQRIRALIWGCEDMAERFAELGTESLRRLAEVSREYERRFWSDEDDAE